MIRELFVNHLVKSNKKRGFDTSKEEIEFLLNDSKLADEFRDEDLKALDIEIKLRNLEEEKHRLIEQLTYIKMQRDVAEKKRMDNDKARDEYIMNKNKKDH